MWGREETMAGGRKDDKWRRGRFEAMDGREGRANDTFGATENIGDEDGRPT